MFSFLLGLIINAVAILMTDESCAWCKGMSEDSSSDGLSDWSLVTKEGDFESSYHTTKSEEQEPYRKGNKSDPATTHHDVVDGFVQNSKHCQVVAEKIKVENRPVCFSPHSPESLKLQSYMATQSSSLPLLETVSVIQLSETINSSSDSDSDYVLLDRNISCHSSDFEELMAAQDADCWELTDAHITEVPVQQPESIEFTLISREKGADLEKDSDLESVATADLYEESEHDSVIADEYTESNKNSNRRYVIRRYTRNTDDSLDSDESDSEMDIDEFSAEFHSNRHQIRQIKQGINWNLDVIILMILCVSVGLGIGHAMGYLQSQSAQEKIIHSVQLKLALAQETMVSADEAQQKLQEIIDQKQSMILGLRSKQQQILQGKQDLMAVISIFNKEKQDLEVELNLLKSRVEESEILQQPFSSKDKWEKEQKLLLDFNDRRNIIEPKKEQIGKFRYTLYPSNENNARKPNHRADGETVLIDLKNAIDKIETQNLRNEINRKKTPSRHADNDNNLKDDVPVQSAEIENSSVPPASDTESSSQDEIIKQLTVVLEHKRAEARKWRRLYKAQKKYKSQVNIHSCLSLFSQHLNSSVNKYVNLSNIFSVIGNVSHSVVENVMEVKDQLFNEVKQNYESVKQTIYEEFGSDRGGHGEKKTKKRSERKRWADTVNEVLNKTRSSVENVSRQIQDTWVHVKNLSEKFWKKYEPSIVEVANKLSKNVADISRKLQDKIKKKASKWMRTHTGREDWKKNSQKKKEKGSERFSSEHHKRTGKEKNHDDIHKMEKKFLKVLEKTYRINAKKHLDMDAEDIDEMCDMFSGFVRLSDVDDWLSGSNKAWFTCQSDWWHDRRDGILRKHRCCRQHLQDWQMDWEPSFLHNEDQKQYKGCKQCAKCNKMDKTKCCGKCNQKHKNKHHGYKNKYDRQQQYDDGHHGRDSYHHGRENHLKADKQQYHDNRHDKQQDWYSAWGRNRGRQHIDEHRSDWMFDRAAHRKEERSSIPHSSKEHRSDWMFDRAAHRKEERSSIPHSSKETFAKPVSLKMHSPYIDPKVEWLFSRANDIYFQRTRPETWYFERARDYMYNNFNFDSFDN